MELVAAKGGDARLDASGADRKKRQSDGHSPCLWRVAGDAGKGRHGKDGASNAVDDRQIQDGPELAQPAVRQDPAWREDERALAAYRRG